MVFAAGTAWLSPAALGVATAGAAVTLAKQPVLDQCGGKLYGVGDESDLEPAGDVHDGVPRNEGHLDVCDGGELQ